MPNVRSFARSFAGGELTPEFFGRIDDVKFQTGLAICRNFITPPHGPIFNRAGLAFVRAVKDSARRTVVRPFVYSTEQTMVLEFGDGYLRFHTHGATLLAAGVAAWSNAETYGLSDLAEHGGVVYYALQPHTGHEPPDGAYWYALPSAAYEIPTPYAEVDLLALKFVQSADVLTITHVNYPPRELRRLGATRWTLSVVGFASTLAAPTGVSATATTAGGTMTDQKYKVSALNEEGLNESLLSAEATCTNNLAAIGAFNTIAWSPTPGAARYYVYKESAGQYGYVGETTGLSLIDDNIVSDLGHTPPEAVDPFDGAENYPGVVTYFEQRRCFAGTLNNPQTLWLTRSGTESDLTYSIPARDDDAIVFRIAAREAHTIRHMVPLTSLLLLTSSGEWRVTSINSDALTPFSFTAKQQSAVGASDVAPAIVNNNLIYTAARGGHVRELAYSGDAGGYLTGDISLRAPHLFDGLTIVDMAFSKSPLPIVWCVSSNGKLLGLTYVPEQQIGAWHQHDTPGAFESICCVSEGAEDHLYAVVRRTIDGQTVRYIERMAHRFQDGDDLEDAFFVDAGVTYDGAPITTVSEGLDHLEGETVAILGDGAERPAAVVTGGQVVLDQAASVLQIGLPIVADAKTLPLAFEAQALGQGRHKNVNRAWVRVFASSAFHVGPAFDRLTAAKVRTDEPFGSPPDLRTGEIEVVVQPSWGQDGALCMRHTAPTPLTIVSLSLEASIGG